MNQKNLIIILITIIIFLAGLVSYFIITKTTVPQNQNKDTFQNNQDQQITDPDQSSSQLLCEKNGGKYLGMIELANGGHSKVCLFPGGKYCEEFGYNKCVDSKGNWQP